MEFDLDRDGKVTEKELDIVERKTKAQRRMATGALISMVLFTAWLFSPLVPVERVNALSDILGLFYIAQAGIVGAYMGMSGWMSRK